MCLYPSVSGQLLGVLLYSHLFVGASGCPGGVGALRMFLRRLARSYGPLLGSNCGVDFVVRRSNLATPRARVRASYRRTHKGGREAPRDYSSRFRRAGLKGPRRRGRREGTSAPRLTRRTKNVQPTLLVARAAPGVRGGGPSVRRLRALRPSRPPR